MTCASFLQCFGGIERGPTAFAAHSAGGGNEPGGVGGEEWGGQGHHLQAGDGAEGGLSLHHPQARRWPGGTASDARGRRRVPGRAGAFRERASEQIRTGQEGRVLGRPLLVKDGYTDNLDVMACRKLRPKSGGPGSSAPTVSSGWGAYPKRAFTLSLPIPLRHQGVRAGPDRKAGRREGRFPTIPASNRSPSCAR